MADITRVPRVVTLLVGSAFLASCGGGAASAPPATPGLSPEEDGTGATRTVEGDEHQFVETVQEMLRGKVAGVQVLELPGCGLTVRIRGMSESLLSWNAENRQSVPECDREPLLIIDNKPVALGHMADALRTLIPTEIERIQVLKDVASTSVYGTRGAYGVILITTKR